VATPGDQGQPVAGTVEARRQGLADAAGRAGDEDQGAGVRQGLPLGLKLARMRPLN